MNSVDTPFTHTFRTLPVESAVSMSERLDAIESDPVRLGWMVGAPPPADRLIRFDDGSFSKFPRTRWSYSRMRQFLPTSVVPRADRRVRPLPRDERTDLDAVTFVPLSPGGIGTGGAAGSTTVTWAESLLANFTDGIIILHLQQEYRLIIIGAAIVLAVSLDRLSEYWRQRRLVRAVR